MAIFVIIKIIRQILGGYMSTHAYFSSGENIDGEYTLPEMTQKVKPEEIIYPKEFDFSYYRSKRDVYDKSNSGYWEWEYFKQYSKSAYEFYSAVNLEFCKRFNLSIYDLDLPKCVQQTKISADLDTLANNLKDAENKLCNQYNIGRRTVSGKLNKHSTLKRLRDEIAQTWVIYFCLTENLFLKAGLNFKKLYSNLNINNDIDVLRCYRGCKIMQRNLSVYVKKNLLTNKHHNLREELYSDFDAKAYYNELLMCLGLFNEEDYAEILNYIAPQIEALQENETMRNIIDFYDTFDYVNLLIFYINKIANNYKNSDFVRYMVFNDIEGIEGNIYLQASNYLKNLSAIITQVKDANEIFYNDMLELKNKLDFALENAKEVYERSYL